MNVRTAQTGGMRAAEFMCFSMLAAFADGISAPAAFGMDFTLGQAAQYQRAVFEVFGGFFDDDRRIGSRGLVSIALTKMANGSASTAGIC